MTFSMGNINLALNVPTRREQLATSSWQIFDVRK